MKEYIKPELKEIIYNEDLMDDDLNLGTVDPDDPGYGGNGDLANEAIFDEEAMPQSKSVWE